MDSAAGRAVQGLRLRRGGPRSVASCLSGGNRRAGGFARKEAAGTPRGLRWGRRWRSASGPPFRGPRTEEPVVPLAGRHPALCKAWAPER